jgi:D-alanyl-D-alanine carboxypeptidase
VTIRQLLGHTSDITDRLTPGVEAALRDPGHRWTEHELLAPMRRAEAPQGAHLYANSNYILLGAILRRASGLGTEALLRREITAPLDLRRTSFRRRAELADAIAGRSGRLPSYAWGELFTDGGMVSTAPDLARFLHALVVEPRLLRPEGLRRMLAPGPDGRYGLGITKVSYTSDCDFHGHIGSLPDWSSAAAVDAGSGVAIVMLLRGATAEDVADGSLLLLNTLRNQGVLTCG